MLCYRGKRSSITARFVVVGLILGWGCCSRALAVGRDYTLDVTQSSIAISGTVFSVDSQPDEADRPAGRGRLNNKLHRHDCDRSRYGQRQLPGRQHDRCQREWRLAPARDGSDGTAPADYGGRANFTVLIVIPNPVYFAGRDLVADVSSDGVGPQWQQSIRPNHNQPDVYQRQPGLPRLERGRGRSSSIVGAGGLLTGNGTLGTLSQGGRVYETLTLPMDSSFVLTNASATINLTLTGQLFATYLIPSSNGDYNQNGVVDAADYVVWRTRWGRLAWGRRPMATATIKSTQAISACGGRNSASRPVVRPARASRSHLLFPKRPAWFCSSLGWLWAASVAAGDYAAKARSRRLRFRSARRRRSAGPLRRSSWPGGFR